MICFIVVFAIYLHEAFMSCACFVLTGCVPFAVGAVGVRVGTASDIGVFAS